ncbi:MAG: DUF2164 domain-containing protein [Clostridia bacterium]|nr:DUF2164 domain-containing protein [Clostridia bacterium]
MAKKKKGVELQKDVYDQCVAHLRRYFDTEMDEPIGALQASMLLDYILEHLAPHMYNQGIADMQTYMRERVEDMFAYMK